MAGERATRAGGEIWIPKVFFKIKLVFMELFNLKHYLFFNFFFYHFRFKNHL